MNTTAEMGTIRPRTVRTDWRRTGLRSTIQQVRGEMSDAPQFASEMMERIHRRYGTDRVLVYAALMHMGLCDWSGGTLVDDFGCS